MNAKKQFDHGFSIIELIVVIVIIGILSAITIVSYTGMQNRATVTSLKSDLNSAADLLRIDQAHSSIGEFPDNLTAANGGSGIPASKNTTYQYTVNNTNTPNIPRTFCLTATKNAQSYNINQEGIPFAGPCPVLWLDAGIATSYPGTGTTWNDLSGNGNNGILSGNIVYDSANGGSLIFDGVDDYATVINNYSLNFSSEQTIIMVMKHTFTIGRRNPWNQAYGGYGTWTHESGDTISQFFGNSGIDGGTYIGVASPSTLRGVWNIMAATRDVSNYKWYINGALSSTTANPYGVLANTAANITIGRGYAGSWQGNMSIVMAYNHALSADEISQIFDALRSRYGI